MSPLDSSGAQPKYLQLADHFRRQIDGGAWQPSHRLPPEINLAKQFEVSRGTMRQALDLLVDQGLLQRTPGKGTFVTLPSARASTKQIGMVVPYMRDSLTADILRGVESAVRRNGYSLIFCHSEGNAELEARQIERLQAEGASGTILFPVGALEEGALLTRLLRPDFPVVIIDRRVPGISAPTITVDNAGGAYQATQHLLHQGHRRIACISLGQRPSSVVERIQGYEQALRDAGVLPLATIELALDEHRSDQAVPTYTATELAPIDQLLSVAEPPSALFCVNDFIALGVMQHVLKRGLRVPQDLAIAGFDDIALAPFMPVPLTTVAQPKTEIGAWAAEALLDQISERQQRRQIAAQAPDIVLPTRLVVRASTQIPAVQSDPAPTRIAPVTS